MEMVAAKLLTVEEFDSIDTPDDRSLELLDGELIELTFPVYVHVRLQKRLVGLLELVAKSQGVAVYVDKELPFVVGARTKRAADVGLVFADALPEWERHGYLQGAPEITIEVLSPSNAAARSFKLEQLCLANGCAEFWVIHPETQRVRVTASPQLTRVYDLNDAIPVGPLDGATIRVREIFEKE